MQKHNNKHNNRFIIISQQPYLHRIYIRLSLLLPLLVSVSPYGYSSLCVGTVYPYGAGTVIFDRAPYIHTDNTTTTTTTAPPYTYTALPCLPVAVSPSGYLRLLSLVLVPSIYTALLTAIRRRIPIRPQSIHQPPSAYPYGTPVANRIPIRYPAVAYPCGTQPSH